MPLIHFTNRNLVRVLATETRRTDTSPQELAHSHVTLGRFLAGEVLEQFALEAREIRHPQGLRQGWQIQSENDIALVILMRAGLYVGQGFREVFRVAPMLHVSAPRGKGLPDADINQLSQLRIRSCVLIDSVVNTGGSIEPILQQLMNQGIRVHVAALVAPSTTAERLAATWPETQFSFARLSDNQYVGKGATDTGNRLFGTTGHSAGGEA
ncbi:MAG: hypothetical protein NTV94_12885 [Planctomycetota bacterium]|nr:hypothetical protein [Planctomycetota bacterium]